MSSGKNPLMLMMALAMPGAAQAIGLGDIHVESNLNERLVAEIDIVGANAVELADLRAAVANRDTFVRLGVERPAFLSSATFKVTQNSQGRPVLAVRSSDSFTEPLVNFLVDLRWHDGELVREYTLLLDPAGLDTPLPAAVTPATPVAVPPAAKPSVENKTQTVASDTAAPATQADSVSSERGSRTTTQIKVGAKATLRGIAWRVGERSPSDLQRMMIAIFRANPSAFDGNINRMHLGALLTIPSREDLASISTADAKREVHAQMTAWRSTGASGRAVVVNRTLPAAVAAAATVVAIPAAVAPAATANGVVAKPASSAPPDTTPANDPSDATSAEEAKALGHRVESLEQELVAVKGAVDSKNQQIEGLQQQELDADKAEQADTAQSEPVAPQAETTPADKAAVEEPKVKHSSVVPTAVGLGTLGAALAALFFRLRRRKPGAADEDAVASDSMADTVVVAPEEAPPQLQPQLKVQLPPPPPAPKPQPQFVAPSPALVVQQDVSDDDQALERAIEAAAIYEATHPMLPVVPDSMTVATGIIAGESIATLELSRSVTADATVKLPVETKLPVDSGNKRVETTHTRVETRLDYNLVDLDMTVQHVHMPSALNETPVVKERRTNLADVLKLALEREPNRHDLRMKLLELYFAAATTNRNGFLDVVQKLAQDRNYRQGEHWEKIAAMGRQILSDSPLFLDELAGDDDLEDVRKVS
jgi:pilus assembly protein FimV